MYAAMRISLLSIIVKALNQVLAEPIAWACTKV
jgi:hypothetical protein